MSKPNEFPQDIWSAAIETAARATRGWSGDGSNEAEEAVVGMVSEIARAILSERNAQIERDARIIERVPMRFAGQTEETIRRNLAQSIRSQLTGGRNG